MELDRILKRTGRIITNWTLLISVPIWGPLAIYYLVATDKRARRSFVTGEVMWLDL